MISRLRILTRHTWFATPEPLVSAQSGVEGSSDLTQGDQENTDQPSIPVMSTSIRELAASVSPTDRIADVCFGEKIASFRQLCKRYNMHACYSNVQAGLKTSYIYYRTIGDFPYYRGFVGSSAIHTDPVLGRDYNYSRMTIINYLTPAYCGRRGGFRYKSQQYNLLELGMVNQSFMSIERAPYADGYNERSTQFFFSNANNSQAAGQCRLFQHGHSGIHVQSSGSAQNPVLEYELPYQDERRFRTAKSVNTTTDTTLQYHVFSALNLNSGPDSIKPMFTDWVAGAEDFSLFFFTGAPVMYYAPSDPT